MNTMLYGATTYQYDPNAGPNDDSCPRGPNNDCVGDVVITAPKKLQEMSLSIGNGSFVAFLDANTDIQNQIISLGPNASNAIAKIRSGEYNIVLQTSDARHIHALIGLGTVTPSHFITHFVAQSK